MTLGSHCIGGATENVHDGYRIQERLASEYIPGLEIEFQQMFQVFGSLKTFLRLF